MTSNQTRQYFTGLDGLRAIAVVFVILFHLMPNVFSGGFIGVPIFFVISGFLMTDSILVEISSTAKFNISHFYVKRLKRLFPALAVMIGVVATFLFFFYKNGLYGIRDVVWTNFTYTNNWWQIFNQTNYFEQANNWAPFTHLWSLSVEAQFYFIWPIILTVLIFSTRKRAINALHLSVILAIVSMFLFSFLYTPENLNRSYYGTDTRLYAFLFGAIISILNQIGVAEYAEHSTKFVQRLFNFLYKARNVIAILSLVILFVGFATLNGQKEWTYLWGTHLVTLATAFVVASLVFDYDSLFNALLSNSFFRYLGRRSYSIYLYQLPVMVIMDHFLKAKIDQQGILIALEIVAIISISELSYRFVEVARYSQGKLFENIANLFKHPSLPKIAKTAITTILVAGLAAGTISAMSTKEATTNVNADKLKNELTKKQKETDQGNKNAASHLRTSSEVTQDDIDIARLHSVRPKSLAKLRTFSYTAIGDSVMLDIAPSLQESLPSTVVDAKVGEQVYDGIDSLDSLKQSNQLGDVVIVVLGMNGSISDEQVDQVMKIVGKRDVYWVNNRAEGRAWIEPNNQVLNQQAGKHKNLHIVDWYNCSNDKPNWFAEDGTHPMQEGVDAMVSIILQSMEKYSIE